MKHLSRSPFLWIGATLLSGLLYFFAFHFFPQTFPIIHLDITMDLKHALKDADAIAQKYNFGPLEHRNAAMFHTDALVKTFVELEGGGKDAFVTMMEEKLYMPYTWRVRHFKEFEKNETTLAFTPDGIPYGFVETISENIPGAQLSEDQARAIVESDAIKEWNIDLSAYTLVESSQKKQPKERIDHTFVYERTNKKIGEGLYRLKIVISGDKITEVAHFVKVPEAFNRRYAEMYSANTTIAWAASLIMIILYLIGGCCFGLYWIIRKRWALFKQPLKWALLLASSIVLASINQLPFSWMGYNSAHSSNGFLIQLVLNLLSKLFFQTAYLTIIIATAESLTRKAFGHHPQLWSLWSTENSATFAIFGRTLAGYLMVGFNCAFVIAFYLLSARYLQWWTPSEMLFDPNILATYVPWLSPIALSLNAGFMEECLFRAIPLAGAALLGTRYGKKNWWIGGAFILQAIVFSAAHASYPTQPSYTRLIELLIPSLIWGATYLQWGLLPTIITHCVYDIIWFSLPIFVSHAPQALLYKIIIILITLLPLLYVIYARIQQKKWTHLPQSSTNQAWQPSVLPVQTPEIIVPEPEARTISSRRYRAMITLGILGLIVWVWKTPFVHDGITITIDRSTATQLSNDFLLHNKNITLNAPWKTLPLIFNNYKLIPAIATQHTFMWKEGGRELYHALLASYLEPAHWTIRYAQFDTDIIQRSEEHKIMLYDDTILRHHHQLPESSAGAQLTQEQARIIAHDTIKTEFNIDAAQLTEISAEQGQLPNRRNWLFIFSNPVVYPLQTGQARISILIAGDKVIDAARTIHVPEEWERSEQNKQNMLNIIAIIFLFILLFFLLPGAFIAFRRKKEYLFSKPLFFTVYSIITGLFLIECINIWPSLIGSFNTSIPFTNQLFLHITSLLIPYLIRSAFFAITITYALGYNNKQKNVVNPLLTIGTGISIGLFFAGIMSIAHIIITENIPLWPNYDALSGSFSWLSSLISSITQYLFITVSCCLLYAMVDIATDRWRKNRLLFVVLSLLYGISTLTLPSLDMLPLWIIIGTIIGLIALILYRYIIRYNYSLIPLATGSFAIMIIIQQGMFNAYPGAALDAGISICAISVIAYLWYMMTSKGA